METITYIYYLLDNNINDYAILRSMCKEKGFDIDENFFSEIQTLRDLYRQTREVEFHELLEKFISNNEIPDLDILPPLFKKFYLLLQSLVNTFNEFNSRDKIIQDTLKS